MRFGLLFFLLAAQVSGQSRVVPVLESRVPDFNESTASSARSVQLDQFFGTAEILDEAARLTANYEVDGNEVTSLFDFLLFRNLAPATVENLLKYIDEGDYEGMFVHRLLTDFVIQGGGFRVNETGPFELIETKGNFLNEFNVSNTRGTLSMAKTDLSPDSATNQWFVSLADNGDNLDTQNGGFTVFGRISKSTEGNVFALNNPAAFLQGNFGSKTFEDVPLVQGTTSENLGVEDFVRFSSTSRVPVTEVDAGTSTTLIYRIKSSSGDDSISGVLNGADIELTYNSPESGDSKTFVVEVEDSVGNLVEDRFTVSFSGGKNYSEWRDDNFSGAALIDESISGPSADSNGDGLSNLQHFFHGVPLSEVDSSVFEITEQLESNRLIVNFPESPSAAGIRWIVERSYDLSEWSPVPVRDEIITGERQLSISQDDANFPSAFYRLKITLD